MPIKKVPICPFCNVEMEHDTNPTILIHKLGKEHVSIADGNYPMVEIIRESSEVNVWGCPKCFFMAFFQGLGPY